MRINTNIGALNAYNSLENTNRDLNAGLAKLSSGYRINKAADDASGLVISENLRSQVSGLQQATRNTEDGISVVQTAEGALSSVRAMLQRICDLVIQSADTGASDSTARQAAQNEMGQLRSEIDRVANTTSFGNQRLLNGTFGAQQLVDSAVSEVSRNRGAPGAVQNRFQSTISNLQVTSQNLSASESQLADTAMSVEMVNFTKNQILLQAGTAMLAQANAASQTILELLQ